MSAVLPRSLSTYVAAAAAVVVAAGAATTKDQPEGTDAGARRRAGSALVAWRAIVSRGRDLVILRKGESAVGGHGDCGKTLSRRKVDRKWVSRLG